MIRKKINRIPKAPRASTGIMVAGNSTSNQEYLLSGEHFPDRRLTPLVLQPFCSYTDATTGKKVENAMPEVTDGCWYRLTPDNRSLGLCEATKISTSQTGTDPDGNVITLFDIVSTPGASDYGRLTIRENVPQGEEITYVFTGTLTADGSPIEEYFNSRCDSIGEVPDIEFDNNPTAEYDPWSGEQYYSINPSLTYDAPAVWKWESYHELEGGWVDLCSTPLDWCIDQVGDGIRIDRKRMPDMILLRCVAEVTVDGVTVEVTKPVTHTRVLPPFEYDIVRVGDIPDDVTEICPYALIRSGNMIIDSEDEVSVTWYNSSEQVVGTGINPTIPLSRLGADRDLLLDVRDKGGRVALMANGALLTSGVALILDRSRKKSN